MFWITVFHSGGGGSILNRLRPHYHLATTPGLNAANNRLSPGAVLSSTKQRNNILSILAGGPRSVIGGGLTTVDSAQSGGESDQLLATMCGVADDDEDEVNAARASAVYGLYENYAAAAVAAAASGTG
jgi:hypothetical protein